MDDEKSHQAFLQDNEQHHQQQQQQQQQSQNVVPSFEYALPRNESTDDSESNKSTPFYTPMEYWHNTFEFPSPCLEHMQQDHEQCDEVVTQLNTPTAIPTPTSIASKKKQQQQQALQSPKVTTANTSPVVCRKVRRFSLYERRSCSPQHLLLKANSTTSTSPSILATTAVAVAVATTTTTINSNIIVADKENKKPDILPKYASGVNITPLGIESCRNSGNNSPTLSAYIESTADLASSTISPKILTSSNNDSSSSNSIFMSGNNNNRLTYSPKLLSSINNLNLGSGSPLNSVLSSAGYKSGNYFKFPEIDHNIVQQQQKEEVHEICGHTSSNNICIKSTTTKTNNETTSNDNQSDLLRIIKSNNNNNRTNNNNNNSCSAISTNATVSASNMDAGRKVKNKNNLTIKIRDVPATATRTNAGLMPNLINVDQATLSSSPSSSKPKTPTLKASKEKALSLDSAAAVDEPLPHAQLPIPVISHVVATPVVCNATVDEIDAQQPTDADAEQLRVGITANRSTSLLHLCSYSDNTQQTRYGLMRRRPTAADWLSQRKSYEKPDVCLDEDNNYYRQQMSMTSVLSGNARGGMPRHPVAPTLNVVASNTNLKTLPEFLTLVEFNNATSATTIPTSGGLKDVISSNSNNNNINNISSSSSMFAFKQKSMDLPSNASHNHPTRAISAANSSTNLLARRGSNHSLTLNLHGSCSNLLSNSRTGISVSNYNLGAVANSRSSGNLVGKLQPQQLHHPQQTLYHPLPPPGMSINTLGPSSSQCDRQSVFRRGSSNQSFTLNTSINATSMDMSAQQSFTTASCSNLNVIKGSSVITTAPKRGLLERRGSNQNLTLNMSSSFGGVGSSGQRCAEQVHLICAAAPTGDVVASNLAVQNLPPNCEEELARKFYSSESLHHSMDMNHAKQNCYSSVVDLQVAALAGTGGIIQPPSTPTANRTETDLPEQCCINCISKRMGSGIKHIATRPLSPQATSEEFKRYLANIQMLQSASNALNLMDLLKLTYTFDNSYTSNSYVHLSHQPHSLLDNHAMGMAVTNKETINSEDSEVAVRYKQVVEHMVKTLELDEDEQKRIFRDLYNKFWDLPSNHQEKPMVFGSQTKNRYRTILPNENSRFMLDKESVLLNEFITDTKPTTMSTITTVNEVFGDEIPYINANYIKGPDYTSKCYVATQGPLPNTVYDFWLMVFQNTHRYLKLYVGQQQPQQYFQKIIMLTNFMECNRQKCAVYFPIDLNEVFITTNKQEVVTPNTEILAFFNKYLSTTYENQHELISSSISTSSSMETDATESKHKVGIETFYQPISQQLLQLFPPTANIFVIKNIGIVRKNGYSLRKFVVLYCLPLPSTDNSNTETILLINRLYCYHYWYPDWPDHRSPHDINTLLDMSLHMLNLGKCEAEFETFEMPNTPPPHMLSQSVELYQQDIYNAVQPLPIIHCSAGIGRTGCLTAILNGIRQLRQSLSYTLTAMAATATATSKDETALDSNIEAISTNVLSPVDFNLPKSYVEQFNALQRSTCTPTDSEGVLEFNSDTDSSFTRNTLMYIHYILLQKKQITNNENDMQKNLTLQMQQKIPLMIALPKLPDVVVDILGIVCNLRLQRGGMVQNSEQYELIHRAICLYLKRTFALKRF